MHFFITITDICLRLIVVKGTCNGVRANSISEFGVYVKRSLNAVRNISKRAFMSLGLGAGAAVCLTRHSLGQSGGARNRVRIPTTATGQAAIGRASGRLQIAFDDIGLVFGAPIYLRIIKDQKRMEVWVQGRRREFSRLRSYKICGSSAALGPRRRNTQTLQPEGFYTLGSGSLRPQPITYLGLDLSWPNAFDRAQGWSGTTSLLQAGCASEPHFGLTDQDMEEVYTLVHSALAAGQAGVPVHIFPFEMSQLRMLTIARGPNSGFWRTLAPAWQTFERTKKPPQVSVSGRRYVVSES
jgi:murein L,D-transpeptidase YafK